MKKLKVLLLEDNAVIVELIALSFKHDSNIELIGMYSSGEDAIKDAPSLEPDLLLFDIELEGTLNGYEVAKFFRGNQDIPVVFYSHCRDLTIQRNCELLKNSIFVSKDLPPYELKSAVQEMAISYFNDLEAMNC